MKKVLCIKSLDYYAHCFMKYYYTWKAWQKSGNESHSFKNVELYYIFFFLKKSCFLSTVIFRKHGREVACIFKDESHNFKNVVLFYINLIFIFVWEVCNWRIYCCIFLFFKTSMQFKDILLYLGLPKKSIGIASYIVFT